MKLFITVENIVCAILPESSLLICECYLSETTRVVGTKCHNDPRLILYNAHTSHDKQVFAQRLLIYHQYVVVVTSAM